MIGMVCNHCLSVFGIDNLPWHTMQSYQPGPIMSYYINYLSYISVSNLLSGIDQLSIKWNAQIELWCKILAQGARNLCSALLGLGEERESPQAQEREQVQSSLELLNKSLRRVFCLEKNFPCHVHKSLTLPGISCRLWLIHVAKIVLPSCWRHGVRTIVIKCFLSFKDDVEISLKHLFRAFVHSSISQSANL